MIALEIPLTANPQSFETLLSGARVRITLTWRNKGGSGWVMDLDNGDGDRLISGIPLVTGCNLLEQYQHIGIPGELWVVTVSGGKAFDVPTYANLGTGSKLVYVPPQ